MEKRELITLLRELDENLSSSFDIVLIGGAAMIIHFGAKRATRDVDVFILRGASSELRHAAEQISERYNLPKDWLNDAAKGFADILPTDFYHRLVPLSFGFKRIRLYALGTPEQVALKIIALREQDLEDLEILFPQLTDNDINTLFLIMEHVSKFRPDWAQKIKYFLEEKGWKAD
jgi:predicted nucleotidyltransferase